MAVLNYDPYLPTCSRLAMLNCIFALLWLYAYGFMAMMAFQTWKKPATITVYVVLEMTIGHPNFVTIV